MEYKDHTNRSQSRTGSHVSHEQETRNLRLEIDHLRKKLHRRVHVKGDRMPPSSLGFDLEEDCSYRSRLRTPPSEFFTASSCLDKVERHSRRRSKSSSPRNIGNYAMSRALHQISKSPFMHRIDRAKLPHRFAQPTFTIYNGMTELHCRVHVKGDRMPPSSLGSDLEEDCSYRLRLRTPPSEFFTASSCLDKVERHNRRRSKSSSPRNIGNDAMSRALHQISKSPFMCRIDRAKLPHRFAQPTFTIYNGMTDPIEHVSHLNQRMVIHFRNEALMCKVFSSSLGLVVV